AWDQSIAGTAPVVACAGCYPTATILGIAPALERGLVSSPLVTVNALSGVSGAGKKANARTHFCHAHESAQAYSACKHRHTPEIAQELSEIAGRDIDVVFTPILVPMKRGLLSMVTAQLEDGVALDDVLSAYESRYEGERFVHFLGEEMPQTASVCGGNHVQIGVAVDEGTSTLVVSSAIDNLDKGAASQAVQCANIVLGIDESAGLDFTVPVV
ncbi:MAG: N-acetyl-gamma-glutamyl-phosphate reductase, partial [Coriobacteriales bacterium]